MMLYHHVTIMEDVVTVCMYVVVVMLRDVVEKFQMMILITIILFDISESACWVNHLPNIFIQTSSTSVIVKESDSWHIKNEQYEEFTVEVLVLNTQ